MKVHLIYPNFKTGNAGGTQEPLGILSVAKALQQASHEVSLTDMTFENDITVIDKPVKNADVLGIGCTTPIFGKAIEILQRAKRVNPSIFCIAGGPHATLDPGDALSNGFDVVVVGEAEKSVVELMNSLQDGYEWKSLPGLAFLEGKEIVKTPRTEFIHDLNELPFAARDLIDQKKYISINSYASMFNVRGCPGKCLYCKPMQNKLFGVRCRKRSAENVAEELEMVHNNYKVDHFYFKDDTMFLCGRSWFEELRKEFDKRNLNISWFSAGRVDQVKEPLLTCMKAAGLKAVAFGVESGSQAVLDFYRKGTTPDQTREAFRLCHKHNIMTHAFIMLGAPYETIEDLQKTLDLFREIRPYTWKLYVTTPFPGNFLHEFAKEKGLFDTPNSYEDYDNALNLIQGRLPMKLKYLTINDIRQYQQKIIRAGILGNVKRCLTNWEAFKLAFSHSRSVKNLLFSRL